MTTSRDHAEHPLNLITEDGGQTIAGDLSLTGDLLPTADNIHSLGSIAAAWKDVYVGPGSLYLNGKKVITDVGNIMTFLTDNNQSVNIESTGTGSTKLTSFTDILLSSSGTINMQVDGTIDNAVIDLTNVSTNGSIVLNAVGLGGTIDLNGNVVLTGDLTTSGTINGIADITDHDLLTNVAFYKHYQIDNHINDSSVHFSQLAISITESQISNLQSYLLPNANINTGVITANSGTADIVASFTSTDATALITFSDSVTTTAPYIGAVGDDLVLVAPGGSGTVSVNDNLVVTGNLTVSGTTTTVNSNQLNIADNIITLNVDETGVPSQHAGLLIERGTSANSALRWNETLDTWQTSNDDITYYDIITGKGGQIVNGNFTTQNGALTITRNTNNNQLNLIRTGTLPANAWISVNSDRLVISPDNVGSAGNAQFVVPLDGVNVAQTLGNDVIHTGGGQRINGSLSVKDGGIELNFKSWTSTANSDIYSTIGGVGTTTGALIQGPESGHIVMELRDNDSNDSFSIVGTGAGYNVDNTIDKLLFQVKSTGDTTIASINGYGITGTSGNWFTKIPTVAADGYMEVGRGIDFHSLNSDTNDFDGRIQVIDTRVQLISGAGNNQTNGFDIIHSGGGQEIDGTFHAFADDGRIDLNTLSGPNSRSTGEYWVGSGATNFPISAGGSLHHIHHDNYGDFSTQLFIEQNGSDLSFRANSGGVWSSWKQAIHTGGGQTINGHMIIADAYSYMWGDTSTRITGSSVTDTINIIAPNGVQANGNEVIHVGGGQTINGTLDVATTLKLSSQSLLGNTTNEIAFKSNSATVARIRFKTSDNVTRGYFYANSANQVGILDSNQTWAVRHTTNGTTEFLSNNVVTAYISNNGKLFVDKISIGTNGEAAETDIQLLDGANIASTRDMNFYIDSDNNETVAEFTWRKNSPFTNNSSTLMKISEDGRLVVYDDIETQAQLVATTGNSEKLIINSGTIDSFGTMTSTDVGGYLYMQDSTTTNNRTVGIGVSGNRLMSVSGDGYNEVIHDGGGQIINGSLELESSNAILTIDNSTRATPTSVTDYVNQLSINNTLTLATHVYAGSQYTRIYHGSWAGHFEFWTGSSGGDKKCVVINSYGNADNSDISLLKGAGNYETVLHTGGGQAVGATTTFNNITSTGTFRIGADGYSSWVRDYSASASAIPAIVNDDGSVLQQGGVYRVSGHLSLTGTNTASTAIFWYDDTLSVWRVHVTAQSGINSNHIKFSINAGVPTIRTYHASTYVISVFHERMELSEGVGTDNSPFSFGADSYMTFIGDGTSGNVGGVIGFDRSGTSTANSANYTELVHVDGGQTITGTLTAGNFTASTFTGRASKALVSNHTTNNVEYPVVWHNNGDQLFDSSNGMNYNPSLQRLTIGGAIVGASYSGSLVSSVTATTQAAADNSTKVATTAFVQSVAGGNYVDYVSGGTQNDTLGRASWTANYTDAGNVDHVWFDDSVNTWHFCADTTYKSAGNAVLVASEFTGKCSGNLSGTIDSGVTAVTQAPFDFSNSVATTQYVDLADQITNIITPGGNITLAFGNESSYIRMSFLSASTVTVPANATVAFNIGTEVHIRQANTGSVTFIEAAGVTINTAETLALDKPHSTATLIKVGTDEWDLIGDTVPL